jgi:hypothetical protein
VCYKFVANLLPADSLVLITDYYIMVEMPKTTSKVRQELFVLHWSKLAFDIKVSSCLYRQRVRISRCLELY